MAKTILNIQQQKLLKFLAKDLQFFENFYLTGGTALAEYYLHHRLSEDLDFFSVNEIDMLWLTTLVKRIKDYTGADNIDIQQSFNRNLVFCHFRKDIIKLEVTYFPFPQIENPQEIQGIKVDSILDIAVNKFFTIYQSPSARHFIDLYLIIKTKRISWKRLGELARIKFDTIIDPLQLGTQLTTAQELSDIPKMIIPLSEKRWRDYFITQAKKLKNSIVDI